MLRAKLTHKAGRNAEASVARVAPRVGNVAVSSMKSHQTRWIVSNQHRRLSTVALATNDSSSQFDVDAPTDNGPREDLGPRDDEVRIY